MISSIVRHGASLTGNARHFVGSGFGGLKRLATFGIAAGFGYYSYGQTYGTGVAALYGALGMHPLIGTAVAIAESGKALGDWARETQKAKARSSFAKSRINDKFGTINMMRQASIQQLSRDHSSRQRILGNEAFYLHR